MVGGNNLNSCGMGTVDDFLNNLIACEDFYIDHIHISGLGCFDVKFGVCFRLDCFFTAFFGSTECHKDRSIAKSSTKIFESIFYLCKIKNTFKPVYTPFNNINRNRIKGFGFFDNVCFCNTNDGNDDLR